MERKLINSATLRAKPVVEEFIPWEPPYDWSEAPEWAQWACVNAYGHIGWCRTEPTCAGSSDLWCFWKPVHSHREWFKYTDYIDIPPDFDWRTTLRARPKNKQ